jgi:hypothetical protein
VENLNDIIAQAVSGNTGNSAPEPAPAMEQGGSGNTPEAPAPAAPDHPFDETFRWDTLDPSLVPLAKGLQGSFTRKQQELAERQKALDEQASRYGQYEGVPDEAVQIAKDYAARLQSGDVAGAETLLSQQLEALRMLKQQQGYGYEPAYQDSYAQADPYAQDPDPVMQRLNAIEQRFLINQIQQEMGSLQGKLGRSLNTLEQQKMLAAKQANPNLSMEQVYYLTNRESHENSIREATRAEVLRRMQDAGNLPAPPAGVPNRTPVAADEPTDMRGFIQQAMREHGHL